MFRSTFRRLLALDDPPERTALAFSIGVFIAFSPFLGLHTIMATLVAFLFRFNKVAIYSGTFINNPFLTLVPIIIASYGIGAFFLGRPLKIPAEGVALRATFIVDPDNVIQHVSVNNLNVGRNPEEILRVLDGLQTDELCPCNRTVGGGTL